MKNLFASFLFVLIIIQTSAQSVMIPSWIKIDSATPRNSEGWGVDIDANGDIYWAVNNATLNQGLDVYVHKYDAGGNSIWTTPFLYGGAGAQQSYVVNASDTALYVGGRVCSGLVQTCDMMLLKIDKSAGTLIWDKSKDFTAGGYDEVDGLEIRSDGIYCGGWCQEINSSIYRSDIGLWKLDFSGNTEWTNYIGDTTTAEHQDGHFVVDGNHIYAAGLWGGKGIANLHNGHSFLGRFSKTDGSFVDSTLFGSQSSNFNDIENALGMTSDGTHLYVTGYSTPPGSNGWQIFVAKFDKNLNQIWFTDWGGTGTESARGIKVENGIIYVAGLTESDSLVAGGKQDAVLLRLDTDGNLLSYQTYDNGYKDAFRDIAVKNGNVYLNGVIEDANTKKKSMLVALDNAPALVAEIGQDQFSIYPNPANDETSIRFQNVEHGNGKVIVYDLSGKQISQQGFDGSVQDIPLMLPESGMYLIQLKFKDYSVSHRIVSTR